MRIHIKTTASNEIIPFNYQHLLTGALHKWLKNNDYHDAISNYSFSWLNNAHTTKNGLIFKDGASFFISFYDSNFGKQVIKGIQDDPSILNRLNVSEITIQEDPKFRESHIFYCASPIFIRRTVNKIETHYTFKHDESNDFLTETLKHKLKLADLDYENVSVEFDKNYATPKEKVIYYKKNGLNIGNRTSFCPVIVKGTPQQLAFAWNVGVGNSTGIGFGALR